MTPLPFKLDDAGCHLSSRPHERRDCVVSALSIVTGLPYDVVYPIVALAGRRPNHGFESDKWLKRMGGRVLGGRFKPVKIRVPSPVGRTVVLTPSTFGLLYPKGRFLLEQPTHTWSCLNGIHHDLALPYDRPLTGAWQWFPNS